MTNKEIIEFFKGQKKIFSKDSLMYEAMDGAIKYLEEKQIPYKEGYDDGYEEGYEDGYQTGFNTATDEFI